MERISIDNDNTFTTVDNAILLKDWEVIRLYMDDDIINDLLNSKIYNDNQELLIDYLKINDLIIG